MTYFNENELETIMSFLGGKKEVDDQITTGVYVLVSITGADFKLRKYGITERTGNVAMMSECSKVGWSKPIQVDIASEDGYEWIKGNPERLWQDITPSHKLDTLFTEDEWNTMTMPEKLNQYCETHPMSEYLDECADCFYDCVL